MLFANSLFLFCSVYHKDGTNLHVSLERPCQIPMSVMLRVPVINIVPIWTKVLSVTALKDMN